MKKYQTIDARTLRDRLGSDDRPVLVNALARKGFDEARIPGSINIPGQRRRARRARPAGEGPADRRLLQLAQLHRQPDGRPEGWWTSGSLR